MTIPFKGSLSPSQRECRKCNVIIRGGERDFFGVCSECYEVMKPRVEQVTQEIWKSFVQLFVFTGPERRPLRMALGFGLGAAAMIPLGVTALVIGLVSKHGALVFISAMVFTACFPLLTCCVAAAYNGESVNDD